MPDLLESTNPGDRNRPLTNSAIQPVPARRTSGATPPILRLNHVSKWYGPVIGVNDVCLQLGSGLMGVVGGNGAGKSTLLRLAAGQLRPGLGTVAVAGMGAHRSAAKAVIGYMPDLDRFYEDMSGFEFVRTMAGLHGYSAHEARRRTEQVLTQVDMDRRAHRPIRDYSKGMRQRIKFAQALIHDPQLLILDEPLSGIDPIGRQRLIALFHELAENGKCVLVSSHELEELEKFAKQIAVMAHGRIVASGSLSEIRGLLDHHPLTVRITARPSRRLAILLWRLEDVIGVELRDDHELVVRTKNPRIFFRGLGALVLEENIEIVRFATLDDTADAILTYLERDGHKD